MGMRDVVDLARPVWEAVRPVVEMVNGRVAAEVDQWRDVLRGPRHVEVTEGDRIELVGPLGERTRYRVTSIGRAPGGAPRLFLRSTPEPDRPPLAVDAPDGSTFGRPPIRPVAPPWMLRGGAVPPVPPEQLSRGMFQVMPPPPWEEVVHRQLDDAAAVQNAVDHYARSRYGSMHYGRRPDVAEHHDEVRAEQRDSERGGVRPRPEDVAFLRTARLALGRDGEITGGRTPRERELRARVEQRRADPCGQAEVVRARMEAERGRQQLRADAKRAAGIISVTIPAVPGYDPMTLFGLPVGLRAENPPGLFYPELRQVTDAVTLRRMKQQRPDAAT